MTVQKALLSKGNSSNQTQRNPGCFVHLGEWLLRKERYLERGLAELIQQF